LSKKSQTKKQERLQQLSLFGKNLVRRCAAHCELCNASSVPLSVFEIEPVPSEPVLEHCLMICELCEQNLVKPKRMQANHWRCLSNTIWSEVRAAKITAVVVLTYLSAREPWAQEYLEQAYLDDEEQAWVDEWQLK
jgi:protein PhnA